MANLQVHSALGEEEGWLEVSEAERSQNIINIFPPHPDLPSMEVSAAAPLLMFTESVTFRNIQAYSFDLLSMLVMSCKESVTESLFLKHATPPSVTRTNICQFS